MGETKILEGRIALVTGGTGFLGAAIASRLHELGARVHVPVRKGKSEAVARDVVVHEADLNTAEGVDALVSSILSIDRRLDILVNAAGAFAMAAIDEDPVVWSQMITSNATTTYLCCHSVAATMKERRGGRIINVAAIPGLARGAAGKSAYAASKAAVLNLTYSLADELVDHGVTVNAIVPTTIDTPANRKNMPDADTRTWLSAIEIAKVVAFLASDAARIVTGAALPLAQGHPATPGGGR